MATLSIDCGTSNTVAFLYTNDQPNIITDTEGKNFFPSIMQFIDRDTVVFGHKISKYYWKLENVIRCFKRILGLKMGTSDVDQYQDDCLAEVFAGPDGYPRFKISHFGGEGITPTEVMSRMYREIGRKARERTDQPIEHLIITVPAFFDQHQRLEALKAAREADICENVHLVGEPNAAAFEHGLGHLITNSNIMVVDIGAGTLDICIMRQEQDELTVIATGGERKLGGEDITKKICEFVEDKFRGIFGRKLICYPSKTTAYRKRMEALRELVERAKCQLSRQEGVDVKLDLNLFNTARKDYRGGEDGLLGDYDEDDMEDTIEIHITLENVRELTKPIMEKVEIAIKNTLRNANMRADDISHVVLVGGSAHFIPFQETVKRVFQNDNKVKMSDNPEEIVARGALRVLNESILTKQHRLVEQLSHSYGTLVSEGSKDVYVPIIPRGTTFPTTKVFSKTFFQVPLQNGKLYPAAYVGLHVCDEMNHGKPELYNPFDLKNLDQNAGNSVTLNFSIDDNGVIYVEAKQRYGNPIVMEKTRMRRALDFN